MEFIVWVETRLDGRTLEIREVAKLERAAYLAGPEELGLTLKDGKTVLKQVQESIVQMQIQVLSVTERPCMHCDKDQRIKDLRSIRLRTVFGAVDVFSRRYIKCTCRGGPARSLWPLSRFAIRRTTPELSFLIAKWGSVLPYRRAAELLREFLPVTDDMLSHTTSRRHTLAVGNRLDLRSTEPAEYYWPLREQAKPATANRLVVTIDGTYIRANSSAFGRQHYVVAGRIERDGQMSGRFAWVTQNPPDPSCFMKAALEDHGCTADTKVAVLADGADGLPGVVQSSSPQPPRRILDWFHLSMRLRPIEQMGAKLSRELADSHPTVAAVLRNKLPRVRHQFWNGKFKDAVSRMFMIRTSIVDVAAQLPPTESERAERMRVHLIEMREYLKNNWDSLTNYGAARRNGLRISSAPAESSMSNVVNQRMGKRQPMSWSVDGAHLLLQVRCAVLDNRLETRFREWHPKFRSSPAAVELPAL